MPIMVRPEGKAKKIAFKIIGTPCNMLKSSKRKKKTEEKLEYQYTARVK